MTNVCPLGCGVFRILKWYTKVVFREKQTCCENEEALHI